MSAQIEALRDRGKGRFPCPSCGTVASDDYDYPYCPRGCSEAQMLAALRARPARCEEDHSLFSGYNPMSKCLTCQVEIEWARREARRVTQVENVDTDEPTGWEPIKITDLPKPPMPSICEYAIGMCLMTPGFVHLVYGASESAKTWLAYIAVVQEVQKGNLALIIDYEIDGSLAAERLRDLGLTDEQIDAGVIYVSPEMSLTGRDMMRLVEHIDGLERTLTVAVLDSLGESTTMDGLNDNDNNDMAAWFRASTRWLIREWPSCAVVVIDHLPKDKTDSPFPIGSQRKRAFPFALLSVRNVEPFSRERSGHSVVAVRKSRDGRLTSGDQVARIDGGPEGITLGPASIDDIRAARVMELRSDITAHLLDNPKSNVTTIVKAVGGKTETVSSEVKAMLAEGLLSMEKIGNAHCYSVRAEDVVQVG